MQLQTKCFFVFRSETPCYLRKRKIIRNDEFLVAYVHCTIDILLLVELKFFSHLFGDQISLCAIIKQLIIFICRQKLLDAEEAMMTLTGNFRQTNKDMAKTEDDVSALNKQIQDLIEHAKRQKLTVDDVIQEDIVGAYQSIKANNKM